MDVSAAALLFRTALPLPAGARHPDGDTAGVADSRSGAGA
jgi:hypothetical protein